MMNSRQNMLLVLIERCDGIIPNSIFQPLLYLFCEHSLDHNPYYDFISTPQGPVSLQVLEDKRYLTQKGYLRPVNDWQIVQGECAANPPDFFEELALQQLVGERLYHQSRDGLLQLIAEHSCLSKPSVNTQPACYTLGYEGLSVEAYVNRLIAHQVRLVCDVRRNAFSRKFGFSKEELQSALAMAGIEYQHMEELGVAPEKREQFRASKARGESDHEALFDDYARTTLRQQQAELERLKMLVRSYQRVVITCYESDIGECHRSRIIAALHADDSFPFEIVTLPEG